MKKLIILSISLLMSVVNYAQTKKVLFLGNSFTYTFDIPNLFLQMANNAGVSVFVDSYTQAGIAVANEQVTGHINDPVAQSKITSQAWDYVVVQDNMGDYVNSTGIPSACGNANVTLYNQIKANNVCTRIIYFSGWGPSGGVYTGDNTQACIDRIFTNMLFLNNNIGTEIVCPIGKSWISSLSAMPTVNLYYTDNVHPSLEGSYLAAATLFTTILKRNPSGLTYTGGVLATTAQTMRNIAYSTVTSLPNYTLTLLSKYTPTITTSGNILTSSTGSSGSTFQWLLNGTNVATGNPITAASSGTYVVVRTNTVGCSFTSFPNVVTVVATDIKNEELMEPNLMYPNPSSGIVSIDFNSKATTHIVEITSVLGQVIKSVVSSGSSLMMDLNDISNGIYYIKIDNDVPLKWVKE